MKKQIEEVQRYFVNRITACEFDSYEIRKRDKWFTFRTIIDGFEIDFSIRPKGEYNDEHLYCAHSCDIKAIVPNDRLENLVQLIEKESERIKSEKIAKLQKELEQLQSE